MNRYSIWLLVICFVLLAALGNSFYTVRQTQKAIVLQLGKPMGEPKGPGLHFKTPFIQNVVYFDSRLLMYDAKPAEVLTKDKKTLVVDNYSKWRIVDPLQFFRTVRTIPGAQSRLDDIIYSQLRLVLGRYTLIEIVAEKRNQIMNQITERASKLITDYGIEVLDVRIKRADLPPENEKAIYNRMRAERERQAKQYRSEGQEEMSKIKSQADRERTVILAEANRKAEMIRGEGDANATSIYAQAYSRSPEFYAFKRSMDAYVQSLSDHTRFVLTPDNAFLDQLR